MSKIPKLHNIVSYAGQNACAILLVSKALPVLCLASLVGQERKLTYIDIMDRLSYLRNVEDLYFNNFNGLKIKKSLVVQTVLMSILKTFGDF